jgi:hypothetical protein
MSEKNKPINFALKVYMEHKPEFRGTAIYLHGMKDGKHFVIEPMNLIERVVDECEYISEPTLQFSDSWGTDFLNAMANALIEQGFRPDSLKLKEDELTATKYHLEDMRSVAKRAKILE